MTRPIFFSVVPNHCWYQSNKYECGLSLSCVFAGAKVPLLVHVVYAVVSLLLLVLWLDKKL